MEGHPHAHRWVGCTLAHVWVGRVHLQVGGTHAHTCVDEQGLHVGMCGGSACPGDLSSRPSSAKSMARYQAMDRGLGTPDLKQVKGKVIEKN